MALSARDVTGWNREARFVCGRCKATRVVLLNRKLLPQPPNQPIVR
jgi:hypothetical protein